MKNIIQTTVLIGITILSVSAAVASGRGQKIQGLKPASNPESKSSQSPVSKPASSTESKTLPNPEPSQRQVVQAPQGQAVPERRRTELVKVVPPKPKQQEDFDDIDRGTGPRGNPGHWNDGEDQL